MISLLLALLVFTTFAAVGCAALALAGARLHVLGVALTAPAVGSAVVVAPLFFLSTLGLPMLGAARLVVPLLLVATVAILAALRPQLPWRVAAPVVAACVANVVLVGAPAFRFGLDWIANANSDMATYVMSAALLLHHGLIAHVNPSAIAAGVDWPATLQHLHNEGARPGGDLTLAALSSVTGELPHRVYMPLILALSGCLVASTAALAVRTAGRVRAAYLAAGLIAVSPLAAYGVLQQLLPQTWGLALAVALVAWLLQPSFHRRRPHLSYAVPVTLLSVAIVMVYVEIAPVVGLAYAIFLGATAFRRELSLKATVALWVPIVVGVAVLLNAYGLREARYVASQAAHGSSATRAGYLQYYQTLVPSAFPGVFGLQRLPAGAGSLLLNQSIIVAFVFLVLIAVISACGAARGRAAMAFAAAELLLGVYLFLSPAPFGVFKLYMWAQPALAAVAAVATTEARGRLRFPALVILVAVGAICVATTLSYVRSSRNPVDLRQASSRTLLPAFHRIVRKAHGPVVSLEVGQTLALLQGEIAQGHRLAFSADNDITGVGWKSLSFPTGGASDRFSQSDALDRAIRSAGCTLVSWSGSLTVLNREQSPAGSAALIKMSCAAARDLLALIPSRLGLSFALPRDPRHVALYQLENDPLIAGSSFSGSGRYALLRIFGFVKGSRLELGITSTPIRTSNGVLPQPVVRGARTSTFDMVGGGSARELSTAIHPLMIDGAPYVLLDLGRPSKQQPTPRHGIQAVFNRGYVLDPRYLAAYVRNISLVPPGSIVLRRAPSAIASLPAALSDPDLRYSGIYEDGWVGRIFTADLAGGPAAVLTLRGEVSGGTRRQHVALSVDGRPVAARTLAPGKISLSAPVAAARTPRHVVVRFMFDARLAAPDTRRAAARLTYLGIGAAPQAVSFPIAPTAIGPEAGISSDGWADRRARFTLAGGPAANLVVEGYTAIPQHVAVFLDGQRTLADDLAPGTVRLVVKAPPKEGLRHVVLSFSSVRRISVADARLASALIRRVGIIPLRTPRAIASPSGFSSPSIESVGISRDGWATRTAEVTVAGGAKATMALKAMVIVPRQRLTVEIDGRIVARRALAPGTDTVTVVLPVSSGARQIRLRFAIVAPISSADPRLAAARLLSLSVRPNGTP